MPGQRRITEYVLDLAIERRKLERLLPEDPRTLRFHGTSSRNLPAINRYRAILPPEILRLRREYVVRSSRGRYDPYSSDIRDKIVSLGDLRTALHYANMDRPKKYFSKDYIRDLEENLPLLRHSVTDLADTWPSTYDRSQWREFLNAVRKGYHEYMGTPHYPVVVAIPAFNTPMVKELDPAARSENGEQGVIAIPANQALFFVPAKKLFHARRTAPRIAARIFPLELLIEYFEKKGLPIFDG